MLPNPANRFRKFAAAAFCLFGVVSAFAAEIKGSAAREAMHLLHNQCLSCHNGEKHKGGIDMTSREKLFAGGDGGTVVNTNQPAESLMIRALAAEADPHMPPKKQLSTNQIAFFTRWIAAGAPWDEEALANASAPRMVKLESLPASYRPVLAVAISPDGKRLAIGRRSEIFLHDLAATNFALLASVAAHADVVRALAWSSDG